MCITRSSLGHHQLRLQVGHLLGQGHEILARQQLGCLFDESFGAPGTTLHEPLVWRACQRFRSGL